jgi:hypothetical protein
VPVNLRKYRIQRTAALVLTGLGSIVAGLWTLFAVLFGAGVGTAAGLIAGGVALLVVEGLGQ